MKKLFSNKRAAHGFDVLDKIEVGIILEGWEVKSLKSGKIDMSGAYVEYTAAGELLLVGARIPSWQFAPAQTPEAENRSRKLLAKKSQIQKLGGMAGRPGYTLIPLEGYTNDKGLIKLQIALVKGRKKYQKKQKIKEKDMERQMRRDVRKYD